ncbi:hypothetical protein [uncultured Cyclobacterium sp.]|uniref:hypothetical protein n=1 Tax=uncultured Cyclobacterium sp. TaxID=453820 RepID=UPI0030EF023C|tara:strand:+ start:55871 stop:57763 length:1893 start_codon:yes stop_codon:yes gene_type:complete
MNRLKLIHYFQFFSLIVLGACATEYEHHLPTDGSISFQVNESFVGNERNRNLALPVQGVSSVVLTIDNEDGGQTIFDRQSLPILGFGDEILIEEINLAQGNYQISAFHLTDSSGNILYATPMEGSEFGEFLTRPLPIPFKVAASESQSLSLEIISTAGKNPESFGFESGMAGFRETFYFFISVVREKVDDFMDFIPAELTISQGAHLLTQQLNGKLNKIVLPKTNEKYDLTLTYGPFQPIEKKITYDSLQIFEQRPLIVEMTKKRADEWYIGGTFQGNVHLSSQSALDSFGLKGYDIIEGSLTIGHTPEGSSDPILDLSALATIDQIENYLIIINNPELRSLEGLDFLRKINLDLVIRDNPLLDSFSGLTSLEYLHGLNLINNPNIRDFNGFNHVASKLVSLHIENMEHFIGLEGEGFENAINLIYIDILSNPNLKHLTFPTQTETHHSSLKVSNNPSLISFGGGNGRFKNLSNLSLENNENLSDLGGLVHKDGEGIRGLSVINSPKLTSLSPLFLSQAAGKLRIENNEKLEDLNVFSSASIFFDKIIISENPQLKNIDGFENAKTFDFQRDPLDNTIPLPKMIKITDNKSLDNFCGLKNTRVSLGIHLQIERNAYNPSILEIVGGNCKL